MCPETSPTEELRRAELRHWRRWRDGAALYGAVLFVLDFAVNQPVLIWFATTVLVAALGFEAVRGVVVTMDSAQLTTFIRLTRFRRKSRGGDDGRQP